MTWPSPAEPHHHHHNSQDQCHNSQEPHHHHHNSPSSEHKDSDSRPPPLPQRRNVVTHITCPTSPTLVITQSSPFASPRTTPGASPRNSPWNSPKGSPFASPNVSPRGSPSTSPQTSPTASPSVFRKPPPPVPHTDSDSDTSPPPAIPERRYKVKEKKKKSQNKEIGYADVSSGKAPLKSNFNKNSAKLNYAELAYPAPEEPKPTKSKPENTFTSTHSTKNTPVVVFPETDFEEFESSYDVPLPIMNQKHNENPTNDLTEQNGFKNMFAQDQFDPFADDPFTGTDWPPSDNDNNVTVHSNVIYNSELPATENNVQKTRGAFSKAHSTENVLQSPHRDIKMSSSSSEISNNRHEQQPETCRNINQNLETRKSWSGTPAHSYSNPAYMGVFDPKQLEGTDQEQIDLLPQRDNDDDMEFYEEDFQILEAQGYSRDAIKRALIVAENNFAMARKILKEFAQSNPNQ